MTLGLGAQSEKYLDQIMVFRFYFRCSKCGAEMSMKTDPKNSDYVMEQGATRNYEPWREKDRVRACSVLDVKGLLPVAPRCLESNPSPNPIRSQVVASMLCCGQSQGLT